MHAWDLEGRVPGEVAAELRGLGLDTAAVAFTYHGGRVLLPRGRGGRVRETGAGGAYFPATAERYRGLRLGPHVAPGAALVPPFVEACADAGVAVNAWTVLCHDDRTGEQHPECCVQNVFGDRYRYALCPSHPDVRSYVGALCADIAATPGLTRMELEALGFMGLAHASLHDKSGIPLTAAARWLLSICVCGSCRARVGGALEESAGRARRWLERYLYELPPAPGAELREELESILGAELLEALLAGRRAVVRTLLEEVRAATGPVHLNVRWAPDPLFVGGKAALAPEDLAGRADSATVTFFGYPLQAMAAEVAALPAPKARALPLYGGFVFHGPDCASEADVRARLSILQAAGMDGISFYSFGMAARPQLQWLARALDAAGLADPLSTSAPYA
jgi:hypothetical protein